MSSFVWLQIAGPCIEVKYFTRNHIYSIASVE